MTYAPKEDLLNVINFSNWTYFNSEKISTKVYDVEISASLYEQLLPSEYKKRTIKEDEVVCIQYRKSVLSEEQDQFLIEKFNKNNFMLLQQKEIQIDVELKNKIKSICNSYIEPQNNNSYTAEILDKIRAAGIEVVTDKDEFDRILKQEERLQKMAGKSPKWLTVDDVKLLSGWGYKEFDDIVQIQKAILLSNYELNDKKISVNKAIELIGREEFLGSISRSAFHWTSSNSKNGSHVHFDSSILFSRDKEYYQNRERLEQAHKESREHIGILNELLTKESYFTFNSEDSRKFVEQVKQWEKDNSNPRKLIVVGNIPPVMKVLGIADRLIEVEHSTLDKMIRDYPLYPDDKQGHKLNIELIHQIPSQLANPVMVFKSKTREDSYVFFTERKDSEGRSILIPLAADKHKGRIVINEITSMYGRNNEIDFVKSNFDEDKLLYIDKERAEQWKNEWALKTKSSDGELESKVQFLGQRITDIETYNPNILTKERLVNFISGNDKSEYLQKMTAGENTYGFVHNGKIYLNPEIMNSNAAVHEYTHLWDAYTQKTNPELWNKGLELFKDSKYWNEVISDPNYQDINDDENLVLSEIHSRICGDIAEKVLNRIAELDGEQVKLDTIDWDEETWKYITEEMGFQQFNNVFHRYPYINPELEIRTSNLKDFLSTPMKDLMSEKKISVKIEETMEKADHKKENLFSTMHHTKDWTNDFPSVYSHSLYYGDSVNDKNYAKNIKTALLVGKAKRGDRDAAIDLVNQSVRPEIIKELHEKYPDAIVCAVDGLEANGHNMIPILYQQFLKNQGFYINETIIQSAKAHHTGADNLDKLLNRVRFSGEVQKGKDYILLDDHISMGSTLRDLRDYIESNGGNVVAVTTLTAPEQDYKISISKENFEKLSVYGEPLNEFLREYGITDNIKGLTDREATEIIGLLSDRGRNPETQEGIRRSACLRCREIQENYLANLSGSLKKEALDKETPTIKNNNEKSQERHSDAKDYLIQTTRLFLSKLKEKNLPFLKGKEQGSIIIIKPQVVRDAATGKAFTGYTQLMAQALIQALYDQKKLPELEYDLITYDQAKACGTFIKKGSPHITLTNYNRTTNSASKQMYYFKSGCNSPEMIELHKESIARNRAIKRIRLSLEEKEIPSERQTEEKNKITLLHYEEMTYLKALNKDTEQYFDSLLAEEKNMLTELCKKTPLTQKTVKELAETLRKDRLISTQLSLQKNSERYFDATECIVPEDFIAKAMAAASLGCSLETTEKTIDSITKDLHQTLSKNIDHYDYGKAFEVGEVITEKCIKNCKEMKNQEYEAAELAKKLEQKQQELKKNPINLLMELLNKNDLSNRTIGGYER